MIGKFVETVRQTNIAKNWQNIRKILQKNVIKDILPQMKFTRNAILVEQKNIAIFSSKIKTRWI